MTNEQKEDIKKYVEDFREIKRENSTFDPTLMLAYEIKQLRAELGVRLWDLYVEVANAARR